MSEGGRETRRRLARKVLHLTAAALFFLPFLTAPLIKQCRIHKTAAPRWEKSLEEEMCVEKRFRLLMIIMVMRGVCLPVCFTYKDRGRGQIRPTSLKDWNGEKRGTKS